jgi:hypothetical protein
MEFLSALICVQIVILRVTIGCPLILSLVELSTTGPIMGSLFTSSQGVVIMEGSWYARIR